MAPLRPRGRECRSRPGRSSPLIRPAAAADPQAPAGDRTASGSRLGRRIVDNHRGFLDTTFISDRSCYVSLDRYRRCCPTTRPIFDGEGRHDARPRRRRRTSRRSANCSDAAAIVRDAAEALADEARDAAEAARYLLAADRLSRGARLARVGRRRLLLASPAVIERSGRTRTLVEMIEAEPGDDEARLRLAKLLLRALVWRPETFPYPGRLTRPIPRIPAPSRPGPRSMIGDRSLGRRSDPGKGGPIG